MSVNLSRTALLVFLLTALCISNAYRHIPHKRTQIVSKHSNTRLYSDSSGDTGDALSRRRKRRGKEDITVKETAKTETPIASSAPVTKSRQVTYTPSSGTREADAAVINQDGSSSLEDLFGLGSNQLRELMEQELPVPREDLITKKEVTDSNSDKSKVFKLPDLSEFVDAATGGTGGKRAVEPEAVRIDRSNREEYLRVLQLNPFADADDTMFLDEYDILPAIFGSGKLLGIPVPYLQTGHGILLTVSLLAALVYAPGNPLTEFPPEIRAFLREGLVVTYSINVVLAVQAFFNARSKNLPALFWTIKTFLLGGIAYYEITQAKDPSKFNEPTGPDPSDRKSKTQNKKK